MPARTSTLDLSCLVCGAKLKSDTYVYAIDATKLSRKGAKYGEATYAYAHQKCLLRQIGNDETTLEELRLGTEGDSLTP